MHDILSLSLALACGENAMDEGWGDGFWICSSLDTPSLITYQKAFHSLTKIFSKVYFYVAYPHVMVLGIQMSCMAQNYLNILDSAHGNNSIFSINLEL